ncbi:hypothetical protein KWF02_11510 [Acinetobacter baumannii]
MKVFNINRPDFKHKIAVVLDSVELRMLVAEVIANKLGIDLKDEKNSYYFTNTENLSSITSTEFESVAIAVHFIQRNSNHD